MELQKNHPESLLRWSLFIHVAILCAASLFRSAAAASSNNETDKSSLLGLRGSISGGERVLSAWNDTVHFCEWPGVTCGGGDGTERRVTALNLELRGLRGTISPSIGNLTFLRLVELGNNSFSGEIPPEIGRLSRLERLDLSGNSLEGPVPANLSRCARLSALNLGSNDLAGPVPPELGSLPRLSLLNLRANRLAGPIPRSLGNASSLTQFSAAYNNLTGAIPDELGRLKKLTIFLVGVNSLSGVFPLSLRNISSLRVITIAGNRFHGSLPPEIGLELPNLEIFYVGGNGFSWAIPESFSNASNLQQLDINGNGFTGQVPRGLGANLSNLTGLFFGENSLGNNSARSLDFIDSLSNCSRLRVLDLNTNDFAGVLPRSVANLSTVAMETLFLGLNRISGPIPAWLGVLVNLNILSLRDNLFAGAIPPSLGNLRNLQLMSLASNGLSGKIPSSFGNLTRIFKLYLNDNGLGGEIPKSISGCQSLQYLDVSSNELTGAVPEELFYPPSYLFLDLSRNSLTNGLPGRVGRLKSLYNLNLSENRISGEIPGEIGGCESLEFLSLQGNSFRGSLPQALASLRGLQLLDLSRNNLTGEIPAELETLRGLLYLNLSFNNLSGEVPSRGAFENASLVSVLGNPELCGGSRELGLRECPAGQSKQGKSKRGLERTVAIACAAAVLFLLISGFAALFWRSRSDRKQTSSALSKVGFLSKVSYKALHEATNGFSPSTLIGTGGFGSVYRGTLDDEEEPVAIKVLDLQQRGGSKSFVAECNALRNIRHRNLLKILTCCSSLDYNGSEFKALVFEYMENGSLEKWLHPNGGDRPRGLSLIQRLNIAADVASAMYYLHESCDRPIVHCDIKPSNVLLDGEMVAHVSDFGLARLLVSNTTEVSEGQTSTIGIHGTIGYVAPEYALGGGPSKQGDVYSYGILVLEMFTGTRPTDEMFKDDFNLRSVVKMALPERLEQIVDSNLLAGEVEETEARSSKDGKKHSRGVHIKIDDDDAGQENADFEKSNRRRGRLKKCLASVLEIGLSCSEEWPNKRMEMEGVNKAIQRIRQDYIGFEIDGA